MRRRSGLVMMAVCGLAALLGVPRDAAAISLLVDVADYTSGSRTSTGSSGGLTGQGDWSSGYSISWAISFDADAELYHYSYTFSTAPSHFNLEVSLNFSEAEFNHSYASKDVEGPEWIKPGQNGNSNPGLPGDIFAVKFDRELTSYSFTTDRAPMWGDFYVKGGASNGAGKPGGPDRPFNAVWNTGFGTDPDAGDAPFTHWIPVPDTVTHPMTPIPSPAGAATGLVLFGCLGLTRRRD